MSLWEVRFQLTRGSLSLDIDLAGGARPIALIGANGSGKTTLLRTILGLEKAQMCKVRIGEQILHDSKEGIEVPVENRNLAYLPQGLGLFPHMTVAENLRFMKAGDNSSNAPGKGDESNRIMEELGVIKFSNRLPGQLSAGERQKVALARVLLQKPGMVLLDEPASALDILARREVRIILATHLTELGTPTLLVNHDFSDVKQLSADLAYLCGGKIVQQGSLEELQALTGDGFLSAFLAQP